MSIRKRVERLEQAQGKEVDRVECPACTSLWAALEKIYGRQTTDEVVRHPAGQCKEMFARLEKAYGQSGGGGDGVRVAA